MRSDNMDSVPWALPFSLHGPHSRPPWCKLMAAGILWLSWLPTGLCASFLLQLGANEGRILEFPFSSYIGCCCSPYFKTQNFSHFPVMIETTKALNTTLGNTIPIPPFPWLKEMTKSAILPPMFWLDNQVALKRATLQERQTLCDTSLRR